MQLTGYVIDGHRVDIRPAPLERPWMEQTGQRFAYRCLPLNIANAHGWEIHCGAGFRATWNGREGLDAIVIEPDAESDAPAVSHFGHGILTFHVNCLFRTEPGVDLVVQGPINRPKDAIAPLTGIVETDWSPYSFTMNWMFTRPDAPIRFDQGEPFCHIFPVQRGALERITPALRPLSDNPDLERQHRAWSTSRSQFNTDLGKAGSQAQSDKWQKLYYHGLDADQRVVTADHRTRLRLKPFAPS